MALSAALGERPPPGLVAEQVRDRPGQRRGVPSFDQHRRVAEDLRQGAAVEAHDGRPGGHGLHGGQAEALPAHPPLVGHARNREHVGGGHQIARVLAIAQQVDALPERRGGAPDAVGVRGLGRILVARQQEVRSGVAVPDGGRGLEQLELALRRMQPAHQRDHRRPRRQRELLRERGAGALGVAAVGRDAVEHHRQAGTPQPARPATAQAGQHGGGHARDLGAPGRDKAGEGAVPAEVVLEPDHGDPRSGQGERGHQRRLDAVGVHHRRGPGQQPPAQPPGGGQQAGPRAGR